MSNIINGSIYSDEMSAKISSGEINANLTSGAQIKANLSSTSTLQGELAQNVDIVAELSSINDVSGELSKSLEGTGDYTKLINKPQIEDVTLSGNKTWGQLGLSEITFEDIDDIIFGGSK